MRCGYCSKEVEFDPVSALYWHLDGSDSIDCHIAIVRGEASPLAEHRVETVQ